MPVIGFIAHLDTADFNSVNIRPQVHYAYDGGDIVLNASEQIVLSPKDFLWRLRNYIGETVTSRPMARLCWGPMIRLGLPPS